MNYLPITLRQDNFPRTNFRKLAANRNKKLYLLYIFLNMVKGVFSVFARKPQKIEIGIKPDTPYRKGMRREGQYEKIIFINV